VTIATADGWTIAGWVRRGEMPGAVVLVHQLSSNHTEWATLLGRLHASREPRERPTTLAIDLRGHGESTHGPQGTTNWQSFGSSTTLWAGVVTDVGAAVRYLRNDVPGAANVPVVIIGSSIGSSAALRYAAGDPGVIGVVMLSPGTSYRGLDTLEPIARLAASGRGALLIAGSGDAPSAQAVSALTSRVGGANLVRAVVYDGTGAHGVSLGAPGAHPEMWDNVETWARSAIRPPAPVAATRSDAGAGSDAASVR